MPNQLFQQNLNLQVPTRDRITKIRYVSERRAKRLQSVLDNAYSSNYTMDDSFISSIKKNFMLYNVKLLVRENEFLREINETSRNDLDVLKSIFNIISTKDINGNTTIAKTILNDDSKTLDYLLKKITCKTKAYNEKSKNDKLYLHSILDAKNNVNKNALQIAAQSNIKCYNIILKYMELNYKDLSKLDFIPNNIDLSDMEKIKTAIFDTQSLIAKSYSLATFYYRNSSTKIPSIDTLKHALINKNIYEARKNLQKSLFKSNTSLTKKTLDKILDTKRLCEKLDDVDKNSADIILSRLKILTDTSNELTPIMQATKLNNYKTLSVLISEISSLKNTYAKLYQKKLPNYLDTFDSDYNTALSFAIKNQSVACVDLLLKSGITLGNDFEYSKCDSYVIQAINVNNIQILNLIIKYYQFTNNDKNSLINYLCATTKMSNYIPPLGLALKNESLECAILLHDKYNIPIPYHFKELYRKLLIKKYALIKKKKKNFNIIERIFRNIINSIISILYFLGIIQFKK